MPRGPSAASLSRYVVALEAEASTGAHTEPPNWLGERPGRLLPEGTQIDRSIGRSVLLFQAVLRRLARPTAVAPVPSIAAAEGARFSNQEEERGGRDGTIRSPARG
jgi:hypothetical protein